jgi:hypothetical protein
MEKKVFSFLFGEMKRKVRTNIPKAPNSPQIVQKRKEFTSEHEISRIDGDRSVQELGNQETRPEITPH